MGNGVREIGEEKMRRISKSNQERKYSTRRPTESGRVPWKNQRPNAVGQKKKMEHKQGEVLGQVYQLIVLG